MRHPSKRAAGHAATIGRLVWDRTPHILVAVVAVWLTVQAALFGYRMWLIAQPDDWTFQYLDVTYRGVVAGNLLMESESVWHRPATVVWRDTLRCETDGVTFRPWPIWSTQRTEARLDNPTGELRHTPWTWTADYPTDGRRCYMVSHIAADIGSGVIKDQIIESPDFVPGT